MNLLPLRPPLLQKPHPGNLISFRNSYLVYITTLLFITALLVWLPATLPAQQLGLDDCIARALDHSPRLKTAQARRAIVHGKKLQALSPPPLSVAYHEEDIAPGDGIGDGGQRIYTVAQDFDIPLLIGARGYLYGELTDAAELLLEYEQRRVRAAVVAAYADLFAREQQFALARRNATLAENFAQSALKRFDAGAIARLEYLQAKSRHAMAQLDARSASASMVAAERALIESIGDTTLAFIATGDSLSAPELRLRLDMDFDALIDRHPLARSAYLEFKGYRSDRNWRWMEYLPSFSASAFRQEYQDFGNFWGLELTAHVPIWLLLSPRGSNEEASGYALEAAARYTEARIRARTLVLNAAESFEQSRDNLAGYTVSLLDEAREIQRTAERSMAAGDIGYLDYVAAMEQSNRILIGYFDALAALYQAASSLQAETGIEIQW